MTVEELLLLLRKAVDEGKGYYTVKSAEFEYHDITEDFFHLDDKNMVLWYEA